MDNNVKSMPGNSMLRSCYLSYRNSNKIVYRFFVFLTRAHFPAHIGNNGYRIKQKSMSHFRKSTTKRMPPKNIKNHSSDWSINHVFKTSFVQKYAR